MSITNDDRAILDFDKPVQQRNGRSVLIYTTTGRGNQPVVGERKDDAGWDVDNWSLNGQWDARLIPHDYDLVNVPQKLTGVLNIARSEDGGLAGHLYESRPEADKLAPAADRMLKTTRIACIEVTFTEGEGLEDSSSSCRHENDPYHG